MQKWKTDKSLYDCKRINNIKQLDYDMYVKEFMSQDPVKDWASIKGCIGLWEFLCSKVDMVNVNKVLDAGTKDGQMVDYLSKSGYTSIGIEVDNQYVKYAVDKGRNVVRGNICDMDLFDSSMVDVVFSHHVFGLCPNYLKAYQECLRVTRPGGYVVTLNDVRGNPKKHFCLIENDDEVKHILSNCPKHNIIYFGHPNNNKELVVILQKI